MYIASVETPREDTIVFRFMRQREARAAADSGGRVGDPSLYAYLADQEGPVVPLDFLDLGRIVFPEHILGGLALNALPESGFALHPVFAGPYRLTEGGNRGDPAVLEAFADFALGEPRIPRIVLGASYFTEGALRYWQPPDT